MVLPLLESDLLTIMESTVQGTLAETEVKFCLRRGLLRGAGIRRISSAL